MPKTKVKAVLCAVCGHTYDDQHRKLRKCPELPNRGVLQAIQAGTPDMRFKFALSRFTEELTKLPVSKDKYSEFLEEAIEELRIMHRAVYE